jgi:acyl-CoA reductase-like NAD-dependent aldehyde dehydrogenase
VASEVSEAFLDRLKVETRALLLAPAIDPGSAVGPLITSGALEKVGRYAEMGFKMGQVLMGGHHSHEENLKQGFFFEPTVVADRNTSMARPPTGWRGSATNNTGRPKNRKS